MIKKATLPSKPDVPAIVVVPCDEEQKQKSCNTVCMVALLLGAGVALLIIYLYEHTHQTRPVFVTTQLGRIEGIQIRRYKGQVVSAFYGIPYAQPPVRELRFQKPVPVYSWHPQVLQATKQPKACYQLFFPERLAKADKAMRKIANYPQSENCLFLSVFVPGRVTHHKINRSSKHPVIVWIHGGAFVVGSVEHYDPSQLALFGDVVVVSIAYRLGIFGFMHGTHANELPGNVGLHDQALAIKWVYENIHSFGGDKNRITLMGESAGAISIGYHLMSQYSRPYFTRAIMQSGAPLSMMIFGIDSGPLNVEKVAQALGCPFTSRKVVKKKYAVFDHKTYTCLRDADIKSLREAERQLLRTKKTFGFVPTQDRDFFPDGIHPFEFLRSANKTFSPFDDQHKELLLGTNGNEAAGFLSRLLPTLFPKTSQLPANLSYGMIQDQLIRYAPKHKKEIQVLFDASVLEEKSASPLRVAMRISRMFGDMAFLCPNIMLIDSFLVTAGKNRTVYNYQFNPRPEKDKNFPWLRNAIHAEEIQFVFGYPFTHWKKYTDEERQLSFRMMKYWSHFARTGSPNPHSHISAYTEWIPCTDDDEDESVQVRWYKRFESDRSEKMISGLPDNECSHYEPLVEEMRQTYRYADL